MVIKITIIIKTVTIGIIDFYNSGIFTNPATLQIKNKIKLRANQIKLYIVQINSTSRKICIFQFLIPYLLQILILIFNNTQDKS